MASYLTKAQRVRHERITRLLCLLERVLVIASGILLALTIQKWLEVWAMYY